MWGFLAQTKSPRHAGLGFPLKKFYREAELGAGCSKPPTLLALRQPTARSRAISTLLEDCQMFRVCHGRVTSLASALRFSSLFSLPRVATALRTCVPEGCFKLLQFRHRAGQLSLQWFQ